MPTYRAVVGANRTVSLPAELCKRLHIAEGTPVEFFLTIDGQVHFHAITATAKGFAGERRSPPISIREMDDAIADYLAEKHARVARQSSNRPRNRSAAKPAAE